ncbi:hypothetical protein BHE90_000129 [Fusarium euwallaceae]|uniref:Uncharacterized protein n=1 Tax=Fusarium euwallaceae TaxID=1147111 RepID=A0A430MBL5_9HYPO|nr:hypothetical protein BHE90_000129 [Fusarium euwallaceae]
MVKAFIIITTTNSSLSEAKKEVEKAVARAAADKAEKEKEEKEEKEEKKAEKPDGDTTGEE